MSRLVRAVICNESPFDTTMTAKDTLDVLPCGYFWHSSIFPSLTGVVEPEKRDVFSTRKRCCHRSGLGSMEGGDY